MLRYPTPSGLAERMGPWPSVGLVETGGPLILAPTSSEPSIVLPRQTRVDHDVASALIVGGVLASMYAHGSFAIADILPALAGYYALGVTHRMGHRHRQAAHARVRALRRLRRGTWQARRAGHWHTVTAPHVTVGLGWMHLQSSWETPPADNAGDSALRFVNAPHSDAARSDPLHATLWQYQYSSLAWRRLRLLARTHQPITYKGDR